VSLRFRFHMKKSKRKVVSKMRRKPTKAIKKCRTYNPQPGRSLERLEKLTQRYAATLQRILTEVQQIRAVIASNPDLGNRRNDG
jgi:hypothetical protein